MRVLQRRLLRGAMNPEQPEIANQESDVQETQEEPLTARQILKKELEGIYDPFPDMTEEDHSAYQEKLAAKIKSGKKLTSQEMNYLRMHCPTLYQMARRIEYKRMKLEQKLKQASSKQEVEEIYNQMVGEVSKDDPDKEAILNTYRNVYEEFKKTKKYAALPETEEEAEAKKLHGKRKKLYLEKKQFSEWDMIFDEDEREILMKLEDDGATPMTEMLDGLPVFDVQG